MGLFNKSLKITEGQKYDLSKVTTNEVSKEETIKKNNKLIKIFNFFNFEGGNSLSSIELAQAMDYLEKLDNGDGKLSKKELEQGAQQLNEQLGLQGKDALKANDLKEFVKNIINTTKKHEKTNVDTVLNQYQKQQEQLQKQQFLDELDKSAAALGCEPTETEGVYFNKDKKIYIKYNQEKNEFNPAKWSDENQTYEYMTQEEYDAATKPKQEPPKQEEKPQLNKYTVQPEETFTQVIKKSLEAQGITNPTPEQISEAKEQFKKDNPNAVKTTKDGYEYLLVGAEVNITGEVKSDKNSKEAIEQWSKDHPELVWKPKDPTPPVDPPPTDPPTSDTAKEKAEKLGYTPTEKENYFLDPKTNKFYLYDPEKDEFRESKNTVEVSSDGSFRKEFVNSDGSRKSVTYGKDGYATQMEARQSDGTTLYTDKKEAAEKLGLEKTLATDSKDIYYDPKTQLHYKWDKDEHVFKALDRNVRMVGADGTEYDKDGKSIDYNGKYQLKKNGTEVYTDDDGSTTTRTYDSKGNETKRVNKDKDGNVTSSYENTYDANGKLTKTVYKDKDGNVTSSAESTYDANGKLTKKVYKDKVGNVTSSWESTYDGKGNETKTVYKDKDGNVRRSVECTYDADGGETKRVYKDAAGNEISEDEWEKL